MLIVRIPWRNYFHKKNIFSYWYIVHYSALSFSLIVFRILSYPINNFSFYSVFFSSLFWKALFYYFHLLVSITLTIFPCDLLFHILAVYISLCLRGHIIRSNGRLLSVFWVVGEIERLEISAEQLWESVVRVCRWGANTDLCVCLCVWERVRIGTYPMAVLPKLSTLWKPGSLW